MRLIDADELINQGYEIVVEGLQYDTCNKSIDIDNIPTAYSVDKVVEELEKTKHEIASEDYCRSINDKEKCDGRNCFECCAEYLIEIVKQGGLSNRKDCEYRHENGNCLKVGGFCTSVDDKHCEKIKQGGLSDDVCEWKSMIFELKKAEKTSSK